MRTMPKKIDPAVKERCVRQVLEHLREHSSLTAAAEVVARREGVGDRAARGGPGPDRRWAAPGRHVGGVG